MKVKLKDMTYNQYRRWKEENCSYKTCKKCVFNRIACGYANKEVCWVNNKNVYSNEFLNQEVAIEKEKILTEEEHEYLSNIIKPFRDRVEYIRKEHSTGGECITISLKNEGCFYPYEDFTLPIFEEGKYYKRMELFLEYTLEELGL